MLNKTDQSRRQAPRFFSVSQDGTWGMYMSLLQSVNEITRRFIRARVAHTSTVTGQCMATLLVVVSMTIPAFAQHQLPGDIDYTIPQNSQTIPDYSGSLNTRPTRGVGGYGIIGRVGHEAGDAVGREGSLSYFDFSPFSFHGDTVFFGDGRLYVQNSGKMGGNVGLGIRHFFPQRNAILGSTFYYDHDESRGVTFEQFTIANEILTEFIDIRANVHLPFGNKQQVTAVRFEPGTEMFVDAIDPGTGAVQGSNISFQSRTFSSAALEGVDITLSTPIQGTVAERYNLEASAGAYHYQARGLDMEKITGFKLRMDGDFFDRLSHLFLEVTKDNVFNTNIVFGADLNYWQHLERTPRLRKSQYNRMASWVRRSRTVATFDSSSLNTPELAINPVDGDPYLIYHVRNVPTPPPANFPAPTGNGSLAMPFQYIQEGIDASPFADIVFVQANSVFDGVVDGNANATAVLRENVLVLGEGVPLTIPVTGLITEIDLPTVTPGPLTRPTIQNATGPIITMASNSRFAGFQIQDYMDGPAILMDGIQDAIINEVIIDTSTGVLGSGVEINNSTGTLILENIAISNTFGDAFSVTGGDAAIVFNGDNSITNSSGLSILVRDAAGSVNMRNTTVVDTGGQGVLIEGTGPGTSIANVTIDNLTLTNTNTTRDGAFEVQNHGGGVSVLNDLVIDTPSTGGVSILELQSTGSVTFQGAVTVTNRNARGVFIRDIAEGPSPIDPMTDIAGTVTFQNTVTVTGLGGTPMLLPAIDMASSSGTVAFEDVAIDQSLVSGINISNLADTGTTTGVILFNGQTSVDNTLGNAINIQDVAKQDFQAIFNAVGINSRGSSGVNITNTASTTRFRGAMLINNQSGITTPAIIVDSNSGNIGFNAVDVVNAVGAVSTDTAVLVQDNVNLDAIDVANVSFFALNVDYTSVADIGDSAVLFLNNENVEVATGIIDATNARGITINADPMTLTYDAVHDVMFEAISATNDDFGINVFESVGSFVVSGITNISGSGGTISGMTVAGARFRNTQVVDLGNVEFTANNVGVLADNIIVEGANLSPGVFLRGVDIRNSLQQGISVTDVSDFTLEDSNLSSNGGTSNNQITFLATIEEIDIDGNMGIDDPDDLVVYNVDMINNNITDAGILRSSDMILLTTGGTIVDGVPLNFNFLNNGTPGGVAAMNAITSTRLDDAALNVAWTGPSQIVIDSNTFLMTTPNNLFFNTQTGVELNIDGIADVRYTNNDLASAGANDVGINFQFQDSTNLVVSDNVVFDVDGNFVPGTGFRMTGIRSTAVSLSFFSGGNNIEVENNLIEMLGVDSTGIAFERIFAPSNVVINNNFIRQVTDFDFFLEEGIVFRDVRGVINLNGDVDNVTTLGNSIFFFDFAIPAGTSNGQIIVNGTPRP